MTLRLDAGQVLIVGLSGPALTPGERAWLRLLSPAGIILFRRNIESAGQTHALLSELRQSTGEPVFRVVDLEGGLVDRLRDAVAPMPAPALVAQAAIATRDWRLAREHGRLIGRETRALGFNTVFAPVLDLETDRSKAVMRTRVVSSDPAHVTRYAADLLRGLRRERVVGCGKHFPGLGQGAVDSHESTPAIHAPYDQLAAQDLVPYHRLRRHLPMVMIAHARYPQASPRNEADAPASISRFWIERVLQRRLGYRGLVVSDDMEMGGILHHASIEDAAVGAIAAGTHLVEICKDPALIFRAYEALLREAENSRAFRRTLAAAARKVRREKLRLLGADHLGPAPEDLHKLRESIRSFSSKVHQSAG